MSFAQQLELQFWLFLIPLLRRYRWLRWLFARMYLLSHAEVLREWLMPAFGTALLGVLCGYLLGLFLPV
ncbi:MAG: hypothetical protein D6803_08325 [Anaerolineae bacterium]|nr:MAG: hypothetical protein D6803_08325 [Anaerolineae bacterium]